MRLRMLLIISITLGFLALCTTNIFAQGGWDVWTINLRDGKSFDASPVWALDAKELKYGHHSDGTGSGTPVARRQILYMSNNLNNSEYRRSKGADFKMPSLPKGDVKRDLVVLDDGRRISGTVRIVAPLGKTGSPEIYNPELIQNGTRIKLTRVAYIKFATRR